MSTRELGKPWAFKELLKELHSWISILRAKNPEGFIESSEKKASIAAIAMAPKSVPPQSYASRLANAPPEVQCTATCYECGGRHETAVCNVLLTMSVEQRLEALTKRGLCFHCLSPGHRAISCNERPTCERCGKRHATLLHDRKFESPIKGPGSLAAALPFRRFAGNATTPQNDHSPATSGEASAQQEPVL